MRNIVAVPVIILTVIVQSSMISRIPLLAGTADLPLIIVAAWALQEGVDTAWHWAFAAGLAAGFISGIPLFVPVIGYISVVLIARLLQGRVWQVPLLAMFIVCFVGTIILHVVSIITLRLYSVPLPIGDSLSLVTLPSLLLNLLLAIPVFAVMRDLARWVVPPPEFE